MTTHSDDLLRKLYARLQEIKAENERLKQGFNDDPIAIIGIGCRLPGGVRTVSEFAQQLASGVDLVTQLPDERAFFPTAAQPHWRSSLLEQVDQFDAAFFDVKHAEAAEIDPQQRILLEVAYHALEDARYPANQLRGQNVGVFIGTSSDDYLSQSIGPKSGAKINPYSVLGSARSVAAGRIAYHFDFGGPVVQLDTVCSSSLMAIHLACSSLREREASLALAGGVALNLGPEGYVCRDVIGKQSRTGKCRPLSADADGFARGEGCGLVVLKRLADALSDGDHIHAVIYASAVNHNGRGNGMTSPNGEAQRTLMQSALEKAGLRGSDIDFVEPHCTGSLVGDSIEVHAIGDVLAGERETPLWLGSTKSRLGHLEAAAAVASVIKVCAMLATETLIADAPIERLNPLIDWDRYAVRPLAESVCWPQRTGYARRAAVNAFGVSGTNVSLILGDPPEAYRRASTYDTQLPLFLCVNGKTRGAYLRNLRAFEEEIRKGAVLEALALGSCLHKEHFPYRRAFEVHDRDALLAAMAAAEADHAATEPSAQEPLAFCFDGGAWTMATVKAHYDALTPFRREVDTCLSACAARAVDFAWLESTEADRCRDAISLIGEYAMAKTWLALGVQPALLGCKGRGLLSAAAVAGVITLSQMCGWEQPEEDAARDEFVQPKIPISFATTDSFSSLAALTPMEVMSMALDSCVPPSYAALPVKRWLSVGSSAGLFSRENATLPASIDVDDKRFCLQGFIGTVRRLYDLGFEIKFGQLYAVPRAALEMPPPGYRFDTITLWTSSVAQPRKDERDAAALIS